MDVEGMGIGFAAGAPDIVHKLSSCEDTVGRGDQLVEQVKFLLRQFDVGGGGVDGQGIAVEEGLADPGFALADKLAAAQQRFHAPDHFVDVDGFYHVIVGTGAKPLAFIGGAFPGSNHQDGQGIAGFAQLPCQFEAVHSGHHDVGDNEVCLRVVQRFQGGEAVGGGNGGIAVFGENGAEELAELTVVLDY